MIPDIECYNRAGEPISMSEADKLFTDYEYKHVARTQVGSLLVSTVWLPFTALHDEDGAPLIFETIIFGDDYGAVLYECRHATEEQAHAGHQKAIGKAKEMEDK